MYTAQQNNYNIPYAILILWKVLKTTLLWQVNVTFKTLLANKKEQIHVVRFGQHEAYPVFRLDTILDRHKKLSSISKIHLVVYYQCCVLIGRATTRL